MINTISANSGAVQVRGPVRGQNEVRFMPIKPGAHTSIKYQPSIIIYSNIYTASQPASQPAAGQPSQPSPASQPARRPASHQPISHTASSQPAKPAKASQPQPWAASHQPASQKEVRHSNTIWEWSTRSGLQKPYGTGERGRNTPPIASCNKYHPLLIYICTYVVTFVHVYVSICMFYVYIYIYTCKFVIYSVYIHISCRVRIPTERESRKMIIESKVPAWRGWLLAPKRVYVLGSKLPLFPYNRVWSSTQ